jgi:hypothetical protein
VVISFLLILIGGGIKNRLNISVPFIELGLANIFISAWAALAWSIFKMKKWNIAAKIALGFISLLPVVFIFKRAFGLLLFRTSFAIYLFALAVAIIYAIAVIAVGAKAKKNESELNRLLKK